MGNEEDAKDVTQESFIKIYKNIRGFNYKSKFSTWIYRIVVNTARDALRKRKETISIDQDFENEKGSMKKQIPDEKEINQPEKSFEKREMQIEVQKAIAVLSLEHRTVLILRTYQNLSYEEISEILDVKLGTVKSRLKRAREALKDQLLKMSYPGVKEI